jgi:hypothetical protein
VWTRKPLFDGKKVMSLLGLQKGGPQVKEWVRFIAASSLIFAIFRYVAIIQD